MKKTFFIILFCALSVVAQNKDDATKNPSSSTPRIVFLGDSLTEGYGVKKENSYPAIIEKSLKEQGYKINFTNASVSGSTTASLMSRLKWQLNNKPDIILIALGANDGLRGFKVNVIKKNLSEAIELAQQNNIKVLLAGMQMPPNYGKTYTKKFKQIFPDLAKKHNVKLIPFLLKGVAGDKSMNQSDGIHPNEEGHKKMAQTVLPYLKEVL
ncbi:MAG: arylesterase [Bdellovibrionales bacterium]|nr:arylesterase [Bdellovibrionales bacterium]